MKNIFFQRVLFTFITKVYFRTFPSKNCHKINDTYADERCWTYRWLSPFNTIGNYLQTETAFKFCTTAFPLALGQH